MKKQLNVSHTITSVMKNFVLYIGILCFVSLNGMAQTSDKSLQKGNKNFEEKRFAKAESDYRIAQSRNLKSAKADYNMGNAIYKQKQNQEASQAYERALKNAQTKEEKHQIYHNLGNALLRDKNYKAAVEAYKNALRNNPKDEETRYNFALAKKLDQENPQQNDQDADQNNNQDQDSQDENQQNQSQQNQDQQNQNPENEGEKESDQNDSKENSDNGENDSNKEQPQPTPQEQASKEQMERLLEAINQEERKVQQRLINKDKKGEKGTEVPVQGTRKKDW